MAGRLAASPGAAPTRPVARPAGPDATVMLRS